MVDGPETGTVSQNGALHTPRSAQAATLGAIVVGIGAAFMPIFRTVHAGMLCDRSDNTSSLLARIQGIV